jgi:hypothetical protein
VSLFSKVFSQKVVFPVLWLLSALAAFSYINRYSTRPGAVGELPPRSEIQRILSNNDQTSIILFVHPKCVCSDATVDELKDLLSQFEKKQQPQVYVQFYYPADKTPEWAKESDLYKKLSLFKDWHLRLDQAGGQAFAWGAMTSGYAIMVNKQGNVIFNGGLTVTRGHRGENIGKSGLKKAISFYSELSPDTPLQGPTFGCSLFSNHELEVWQKNSKQNLIKLADMGEIK